MKKLTRSFVALVACLGVVAVGCSSKSSTSTDTSSDQDNSDSSDSSASEGQASRMDEKLFGPISSTDPNQAAGSVAAAQWWPAGCATREKDATNALVVHIHLNDCTGPFGLVHHTGDITVTFSKNSGGGLHAEATSSNMTVNGKAVQYSSSADVTVASGDITVVSHGAWDRDNAKGETVSHTRSVTTVIDIAKKCRTTNGTAQTVVGAREVDSTIKNYEICRKADGTDGCPSGEVDVTAKASGKSLTLAFDGSAQCKITGPAGNSVEVPLVCTP